MSTVTAPDTKQTGQGEEPAGPFFKLRVVNANTDEPVVGLKVSADGRQGDVPYSLGNHETDAKGEVQIRMPMEKLTDFILFTKGDGYPTFRLSWLSIKQEVVPDGYEFRIRPAGRMGGLVKNERGEPVIGATVQPFWRRSLGDEVAHETFYNQLHKETTDGEGRWACTHYPEESMMTLNLRVQHGDYPNAEFATEPSPKGINAPASPTAARLQAAELKAGTALMIMARWLEVSGTVEDRDGRPVGGANIHRGEWVVLEDGRGTSSLPPGLRSSGTVTDHNGEFRLSFATNNPGRLPNGFPGEFITVEAEGYSPQTLSVKVVAGMEPLKIVLEPGNVVNGKVIDEIGNPISSARVQVKTWQTQANVGRNSNTDNNPQRLTGTLRTLRLDVVTAADGHFQWSGAPAGTLTFSAVKEGFEASTASISLPNEKEVTVKLRAMRFVNVTALDADTRQPITNYTLTLARSTGGSSGTHVSNGEGRHRIALSPAAGSYLLHAEADGYMRQAALPIKGAGGPSQDRTEFNPFGTAEEFAAIADPPGDVTRVFELKRGEPIEGTVVDLDGKPVAGAQVTSHSSTAGLMMNSGRFSMAPTMSRRSLEVNSVVSTDAAGHFKLPIRPNQWSVLAAHDHGFAEVILTEFNVAKSIKLQPWAQLEGILRKNGQPRSNERLFWEPANSQAARNPFAALPPGITISFNAVTDSDGKFSVARIPPGTFKMTVSPRLPGINPFGNELLFKSGETLKLELGD